MTEERLDVLATVLAITAAVPALILWATYSIMAPWHRTTVGRQIWSLYGIVAAFLVYRVTVRLFGPYPGQTFIAFALYGVLTWVLWRQCLLIWREQRKNRLRFRRREADRKNAENPLHPSEELP